MVNLNKAGQSNAKKLIRQGKVDMNSPWKFTSKDRNKLLGEDNWSEYKKWFLAVDSEKPDNTKAHYKFPFGKNGKVYRSGVIAAKKRAAQYGYSEIEKAAGVLLELIDSASNWFKMEAKDNGTVEALIYGGIGYECAAEDFIKSIKENDPKKLTLRINSPGGNVFEGLAIYNYLKQANFDVDVYIDGLAASAASVIACAGNVYMPENTIFMIHNPSALVGGYAEDMRKEADILDRIRDSIVTIYQEKSGQEKDELIRLMDEESWLNANEAKELGFCDEVIDPLEEMAVFDVSSIYNNVPDNYVKRSVKMSKEKKFFASLFEAIGVDIDLDNIDAKAAYEMVQSQFVQKPKEPELPEDVVAQLKDYENKIAALETANLVKQIEPRVGAEVATIMGKCHRDMKKEVFDALVEKIEGMRKAINELGAKKGSAEVPENKFDNVDDVVEKKTAEIAKELGCSMTDALIELAKRDPELVANWR